MIARASQRVLAALFFAALACTGVAAFYEHDARVRWQEARGLQGEESYDAEESDRRYASVDIWRGRRSLSFRSATFLGAALATIALIERRRRLR